MATNINAVSGPVNEVVSDTLSLTQEHTLAIPGDALVETAGTATLTVFGESNLPDVIYLAEFRTKTARRDMVSQTPERTIHSL